MSCASCVAALEGALRAVPGVLEVGVNLATAQVCRQPATLLLAAAAIVLHAVVDFATV